MMTRTIIIGDIHGCFDELQALLARLAPTRDDQIIALGDIVDRGPQSERVLEFFRDTPNARSLMGNHERKHIRSARGPVRPALSQVIVRAELADRYDMWLDFMETLPQCIELPEAILIHGFFEPGLPLAQQRDTVVVGTLTGEFHIRQKCGDAWYEHYEGAKPLVCGHRHYRRDGQPLIRDGRVYAIDTGCATGSRLTALVLPGFQLESVPAARNYWAEARLRYASAHATAVSPWDLEWEKLHALAESVKAPSLPPDLHARAAQCVQVATTCAALGSQVLSRVQETRARIESELRADPIWPGLSPEKQAARYARRVVGEPAEPLLFDARRGRLGVESLQRRCRTPRDLAQLARVLGLVLELPVGITIETEADRARSAAPPAPGCAR